MEAQIVLKKAKRLLNEQGLTYQEVGEKMGYPKESACQSVSQFLNGTNPSVAMILRFAEAIGVEAKDLFED